MGSVTALFPGATSIERPVLLPGITNLVLRTCSPLLIGAKAICPIISEGLSMAWGCIKLDGLSTTSSIDSSIKENSLMSFVATTTVFVCPNLRA